MEQVGFALTPREHDVVKLFCRGFITKTAAHELGLSPKTVEVYITTARERNECNTIPQLVGQYVEARLTGGLVLLPPAVKGPGFKQKEKST